MRVSAAFLFLTLALSGCSGGKAGPDADDAMADGTDLEVAKMVTLNNGLAAPIHRVQWENGSFATTDSCNTGGCLSNDGPGIRRFTVEVPRDVPVRLGVDLTFDPAPWNDIFGGMDAFIEADATFFRYSRELRSGHVRMDATILPTSNAEVLVLAYNPTADVPEIPYTLRIQVDAESEQISAGIPVAVQLAPGATVELRAPSAVTTTFVLYAPDDSPVGRFETNYTVPADAPEGEYVILIPPGAPDANVSTDGGALTMQTIGLRGVAGDPGTVPPNGPYEATLDVTGYPLAVGFLLQSTATPLGFGLMASTQFSARLEGPNGLELDSGPLCGLCINGQFGFGMLTESGDPRVVAATYTLHVETQATHELEATQYAIYLQRFVQ